MSLYLTIFQDGTEIIGWVLGHYSDFGYFRDVIAKKLNASEFPLLLTHSDCDGEWSVEELKQLRAELQKISSLFQYLPVEQPIGAFEHTEPFCRSARSLYDCFHNVDGENLIEALIGLCDEGIRRNVAVLFQ